MDRRNIPQRPPLSYFIRITTRQPKIRIKVPKLLAKTMQKRFDYGCSKNIDGGYNKQHCTKEKKKLRNKPRKLLPRKISSLFTYAFGNMKIKSPEKKSSSDGRCFMKSKTKCNSRANDDVTNLCAPFCYIKGDNAKRVDIGVAHATFRVIGEQESSGNLNLVPSKFMPTNRWKSRMARSLTKMVNREIDGEDNSKQEDSKAMEERGAQELCKKRILMGSKCRPLSLSGTLQYDENGILITEIMP
ncbi:unnamed protein product [Prunus armeniaca]|uniref:Uncharacterized protein n=1 Tax=Prunus armeniaca TaxID=36596 RepID=A0A6J5VC28_PRUAR|nr:unnamed protein product [Prunus armeniaca]